MPQRSQLGYAQHWAAIKPTRWHINIRRVSIGGRNTLEAIRPSQAVTGKCLLQALQQSGRSIVVLRPGK